MLKSAILFSLIFSFVGAKISHASFFDGTENKDKDLKVFGPISVLFYEETEPTWVIRLDDLDNLSIRRANEEEESIFDDYVGFSTPTRSGPRRSPSVVTQSQTTPMDAKLLEDSLNYAINKFLFSAYDEDGTNMPASIEDTSHLAIFYRSDVTSVAVVSDKRQRHYMIRSRLLPEWFYTLRPNGSEANFIPVEERVKLFTSLLRLLKMFNSFPM